MARYFKKELPGTPIFLPVGKAIRFEVGWDQMGYYATNNGYEVAELLKCAEQQKGGISEITQEQFEEAQKKTREQGPNRSSGQRPTIGPLGRNQLRSQQANAVVPSAANVVGVMADGRAISSFSQPQKTEGLTARPQFVKPKLGKAPPVAEK